MIKPKVGTWTKQGVIPDKIVMIVPGLPERQATRLASKATDLAAKKAPKLHGSMASRLTPIHGKDFFRSLHAR